jgi:hypothetical protein
MGCPPVVLNWWVMKRVKRIRWLWASQRMNAAIGFYRAVVEDIAEEVATMAEIRNYFAGLSKYSPEIFSLQPISRAATIEANSCRRGGDGGS